MKKFTSTFGRLFLSAVLIFLVFYTMMPAINLHDQDFIVFLIICILIVAVNFMESILIFLKTVQQNRGVEIVRDPVTGRMVLRRKYADASGSPFAGFKAMGRPCKYGTIAIAVLIFFSLIASAAGIQLFASWAFGGALDKRSAAYLLLDNFLVVAVSEEVCKIVPVRLAAWKHPAFDYRFDAVVYSVSSALGFAAVENILYVVQSDLRTAVSRAVLSVPGHFFFAVAMGLLLSRGKQAEKQGNGRRRTVLCALAILMPVVLHGIWDVLLAVRRPWATVVFYCFVVAFFIAADLGLRRASQTDAHL